MLQFNDGNWEHRAFWGPMQLPGADAGTRAHVAMGELPEAGKWVRLEVEASKVGLNPGAVITGWAFTQHGGTVFWDRSGIATRTPQGDQQFESLTAWETFEPANTKSTLPQPVQAALKVEEKNRTDEHRKTVRDYFLTNVYVPTRAMLEPLRNRIADLEKQSAELDAAIPTTLVMADMPEPRDSFGLFAGLTTRKGSR